MNILLESYIKELLYQENLNKEVNEATVKELVLGLGILTGLGSLAYDYVTNNSNNLPAKTDPSQGSNETINDLRKQIRNKSGGIKLASKFTKSPNSSIEAMAFLTGENPDNYGVINKGKLILTVDFIIKLLNLAQDSNEFSTKEEGHIFGKENLNKYVAAFEAIEKVALETGIPTHSAKKFADWEEGFLVNGNEDLAAFFADALTGIRSETDSFFNDEIENISSLAEVDINALMGIIAKNKTTATDTYTVLAIVSSAIKSGRLDVDYDLIPGHLKGTLETLMQQIKECGE
jgi:hypothetical protein